MIGPNFWMPKKGPGYSCEEWPFNGLFLHIGLSSDCAALRRELKRASQSFLVVFAEAEANNLASLAAPLVAAMIFLRLTTYFVIKQAVLQNASVGSFRARLNINPWSHERLNTKHKKTALFLCL